MPFINFREYLILWSLNFEGPLGVAPNFFWGNIFFNVHKMVHLEFRNHFGSISMGITPSTERGRWAQMITLPKDLNRVNVFHFDQLYARGPYELKPKNTEAVIV